MSDIAQLVKDRLIAQLSSVGAIAIASNLGAAVSAASVLPAVYVIRAARTAEANTIETGGFSQRLTKTVSVLLIDRVSGDVSGEVTSLSMEMLSDSIQVALMGWEPDAEHDPMEYTGGALAEWTEPALMLWMDEYVTTSYREVL